MLVIPAGGAGADVCPAALLGGLRPGLERLEPFLKVHLRMDLVG